MCDREQGKGEGVEPRVAKERERCRCTTLDDHADARAPTRQNPALYPCPSSSRPPLPSLLPRGGPPLMSRPLP